MNVLKTLSGWIDFLNEWVGRGVSWVTLGLVLVVFVDVVMRYLFNTSFVFTQELEWHLFGVMFLLGAGYTLLQDGHVRVDVLYQRFSPRTRAWRLSTISPQMLSTSDLCSTKRARRG